MKKLFVLALCIFLFGCSAGVPAASTEASTEEIDYDELFNDVVELLKVRADVSVVMCGVTNKIWYDAIHEKKYSVYSEYVAPNGSVVSFSEAIENFHKSEEYQEAITELNGGEKELKDFMKQLKDAPEEYQDAYEHLLDAYTTGSVLMESGVNPSGTYNDYSTTYNRQKEEFDKAMQKVDIYLP